MTALPLPQMGRGVELGADRRRTQRIARQVTDAVVSVTASSGEHTEAAIRNVSAHGCNLQSGEPWLRMGRFITIDFGSERSVQGIVRWVRDGSTGIEFLRPISSAEVQQIASGEG